MVELDDDVFEGLVSACECAAEYVEFCARHERYLTQKTREDTVADLRIVRDAIERAIYRDDAAVLRKLVERSHSGPVTMTALESEVLARLDARGDAGGRIVSLADSRADAAGRVVDLEGAGPLSRG